MTRPQFVLVPQWQGSPSSRAMRLSEGAALLREDLPQSALHEVQVPSGAGDSLGSGVARLSSILQTRDRVREVLAGISGVTLTVGGDCASALASLEHTVAVYGADRVAVLWCDAHPDLHTPESSPSGAASGMVLRHALGEGDPDLVSRQPLAPDRVILFGERSSDAAEAETIARLGIVRLPVSEPSDVLREAVLARLDALRQAVLYVHIDLDVLDPSENMAVHAPVPFGVSLAALCEVLTAAVQHTPLVAASLAEFAPADQQAGAESLSAILRLFAALTAGAAR